MMDDYSQFALPEEERRRLLFSNLMMGLGAGLLDSRGKNVFPAVSAGLLGGLQMGQQAIGQAQRGMVDAYKLKREIDADKEKKALAAARAGVNKEISDLVNAPGVDPAKKWEIYSRAAEIAATNGDEAAAKHWAERAEKFRPKYSATPHTVMGADGKPVLVQTSEYEQPRELTGYQPKPEYKQVDTGSQIGFYDPLTQSHGGTFSKTMTPGEAASNEVARGNLGIAQANLGLSRERLSLDKTNAQRGEAWTNDLDRGIQIDPRTGQSRPITSSGAPVGAKGASKQAEQSKTALTIISEAERLIDKSTGSYIGAGIDQAARVFGGSTEGADASAQLQALEGALMLNQPRMEGPQSDKDTALYKQMAAKIGDPTVPNGQKKAALAVVKKLHQKYATGVSVSGATGGWSIQEVK